MDPREAAFLASQAERLACTKKRETSECGGQRNNRNSSTQFFADFRKICSEFHNELDMLLRMPSSSSTTNDDAVVTITTNDDDAKSYYATASKRNEGRLRLDAVQKCVRLLQNHVLSSSLSSFSSSSSSSSSNDDNAIKQVGSSALLQSILQNPMGEITQTDMRLLSQEINMIMKRIDEARDLVCPKEKFIFKRYRAAMEKAGEEAISADNNVRDGTTSSREGCMSDETIGISPLKDETNSSLDIIRSKFGGVLENLSDCTIEISSDNTTIFITEAMADHGRLQYYTQPRSIHAL